MGHVPLAVKPLHRGCSLRRDVAIMFAGNKLKAGPLLDLTKAIAFAEATQLWIFRRGNFDSKFLYLG